MKKIDTLIADVFKRLELGKYKKRSDILDCWSDIVGAELAELARPAGCDRSVILVRILHPVAGMEIRLRKEEILSELNRISGDELFTDIKAVMPGKSGRQRSIDRTRQTKNRLRR
jgi:predicted nucleic acid-binding Zn ribbon protein